MKIGIISPNEGESASFITKLEGRKDTVFAGYRIFEGKYCGSDIAVIICGVCKVNAAAAAQIIIDRYNAEKIIVCGVAGGIDPELKIGDTVLCEKTAYHDVVSSYLQTGEPFMEDCWFKSDARMLKAAQDAAELYKSSYKIYTGSCVTGEAFIADEGREEIITKYDPLSVDMETAAAAHVCYINKIPFFAIRSITDTAEHSGLNTFHENLETSSAEAQRILEKTLEKLSNAN